MPLGMIFLAVLRSTTQNDLNCSSEHSAALKIRPYMGQVGGVLVQIGVLAGFLVAKK